MAQPITAAAEVVPRDGLGGAVGYGVNLPDSDALDPNNRWRGPLPYRLEGLGCGPGGYTADADPCAPSHEWEQGRAFSTTGQEQRAFVIGAAFECSTFGAPSDLLAAYGQQARRALELAQWPLIANELWTGTREPTNHHLASSEAVVLSATAVDIVEAIAALEDAFGDCSAGDVQVIHVPRKLVAYLDAAGIIHTTVGSGRIWTANNSLVVADRGYPGTDPDGVQPDTGTYWIYSTGPLSARLGAVVIPERDVADAIAWETNRVSVRAERLAAIDWLCCHLAIPVDLGEGSTVPASSPYDAIIEAGLQDAQVAGGLDWFVSGEGN